MGNSPTLFLFLCSCLHLHNFTRALPLATKPTLVLTQPASVHDPHLHARVWREHGNRNDASPTFTSWRCVLLQAVDNLPNQESTLSKILRLIWSSSASRFETFGGLLSLLGVTHSMNTMLQNCAGSAPWNIYIYRCGIHSSAQQHQTTFGTLFRLFASMHAIWASRVSISGK